MSITIHIHLLNGDVLEHVCRARKGSTKFATAKPSIDTAVLRHLGVSPDTHDVVLTHSDDEACMAELHRTNVDKWNRVYRRPVIEEAYEMNPLDAQHLNRLRAQMEKQRTYTEGSVIYAFVKEMTRWQDVDFNDHDSDMDDQ